MSASEAISAAVTPSTADLIEARAVVVDALGSAPSLSVTELHQAMITQREVPAERYREAVKVGGNHARVTSVDETAPALLRRKAKHAIDEAVGLLQAEGVIMRAAGGHYGPANESIAVEGPGWSGAGSYDHHFFPPAGTDSRWKLTASAHGRAELARTALPDELPELLRQRGVDVLREATRAFHRGLYIAAADLLAAASEAAWFTLGGLITDDRRLEESVTTGTNAAEVIHRTGEALLRMKALEKQTLNDLRAQAARLRDLRNYGMHPVGEPDADREPAFTEAGCAVLFMTAPRYFRQLETVRLVLLKPEEQGTASAAPGSPEEL